MNLGDRIKQYEFVWRYFLPRRNYTIIRIDGKAFHTYTNGLNRPFDDGLINDMDETAKYLCKNIQGAKFGYVQSDEISILLTDFDDLETSAGINWNNYDPKYKRGRLITKEKYLVESNAERNRWTSNGAHIFTEQKEILLNLIPDQS